MDEYVNTKQVRCTLHGPSRCTGFECSGAGIVRSAILHGCAALRLRISGDLCRLCCTCGVVKNRPRKGGRIPAPVFGDRSVSTHCGRTHFCTQKVVPDSGPRFGSAIAEAVCVLQCSCCVRVGLRLTCARRRIRTQRVVCYGGKSSRRLVVQPRCRVVVPPRLRVVVWLCRRVVASSCRRAAASCVCVCGVALCCVVHREAVTRNNNTRHQCFVFGMNGCSPFL